jgi:integrase
MSRPWKKQWPRLGRNGRKSYIVGYYDHDRVERSKTFASASGQGGARDWMRDYIAAERKGPDSLERFLRDLDAKEANVRDGRPLGQIVAMYFALDADPALEGGLAPATFAGYQATANPHILGRPMHNNKHEVIGRKSYATWLAARPASEFNEPHAPRQYRDLMRADGQTQKRIKDAWKVLSVVLSWAAGSHEVPEIHTNGCILANERATNRRRSVRAGSTGKGSHGRKRRSKTQSWALSPQAVEAIRREQLARLGEESPGNRRDAILAKRDAIVTSLMYGLGARPQEIWGMRWCSISETFAEVEEVISWGELDEYGKTSNSTERRPRMPRVLYQDLLEWRLDLREWGHPAGDLDFIIPGDLGGKRWGVIDPDTGACHLSLSQCKKWGTKFFGPAVARAAARTPELAAIAGATPYSLRRGGISVRLRAEDPQTVAKDCGTSLRMLDEHYAFAIDDLRRFGPRPFDEEWAAARKAPPSAEAAEGLLMAA